MKPAAWRAALRIARRDALRAKGRSALVLAMLALPVLGVTGADIVYRSATLSPVEKLDRELGRADLLVSTFAPGETVEQPPGVDGGAMTVRHGQDQPSTPEQQRSLATDPAALVAQLLPAGSTLNRTDPGPVANATSHDGLLRTETAEADLADGVWAGRIDVVEGRVPSAPGEVAVTRSFLDKSGLRLGDRTTLGGLESQPYTLTAVVEYPGELTRVELVGRPGEVRAPLRSVAPPVSADPENSQAGGPERSGSWLVRLPAGAVVDWAEVQDLNKYGFRVTSRTVALHPPTRSQVPYYRDAPSYTAAIDRTTAVTVATVVGMALLEVVLLAGPAFAVGARRSRRQLALLAAAGGDRAQLRAVVLGGGVLLGTAGAVLGVVTGVGLVAALRPWAEATAGSRFGHFDVRPLDLLGVAAVGLVTGLLAAVLPAVQASRQDVVLALTGRGAVRAPSRLVGLLGLVMVAGGAALALFGAASGSGRGLIVAAGLDRPTLAVLGGSVVAELGVVACTPVLVGLFGRLGRRLPLSPRLAVRDAVRHRSRTAPAVAAVLAAVAGSVAVGIYTASSDAQSRAEYRARVPSGAVTLQVMGETRLLPQLRSAVEQAMPELGTRADVYRATYEFCPTCGSWPEPLRAADDSGQSSGRPPGGPSVRGARASVFGGVAVGDAAVLHNLFAVHDAAAENALAAGKAVVFDPAYLKDGKVVFRLVGGAGKVLPGEIPKPAVQDVSLDAVLVDRPAAARYGTVLLGPDGAQRLGLVAKPVGSVWLPAAVPGRAAEQRAAAAVSRSGELTSFGVERGYPARSGLVTLALTGFAALVVLGATGIATGLSATDSQQDMTTLAAVGAAPGIRRRLSAVQAGLIAVLGTTLGTLCGFVPAIALRRVRDAAAYGPAGPVGSGGREAVHASPIVVPWSSVALILLALPLLAALLAALVTRSRIVLLRRTP